MQIIQRLCPRRDQIESVFSSISIDLEKSANLTDPLRDMENDVAVSVANGISDAAKTGDRGRYSIYSS